MSADKDLEIKSKKFLRENPTWSTMYLVYQEFFKKHGAQSISSKYIDDNGNALGSWFRYQRQRFDANLLPDEAIYLLNQVNPKWSVKTSKGRSAGDRSIQWDNRYQLVKEFIAEFGSSVSARTQYKDQNIGYWVVRQRTSFEKGTLDQNQIERLKELNFIVEDGDSLRWNN
ncbi:helicase associated domain-containing protein [Photobacterium damselae]|uniref:helicase associated domain-containing protein n=1 Tax=Photobacterium damselae TaxID=38293 RepID=UPI001F48FFE2|nr:helicase associated domain-containing protein [Photobacterium damselae]UKA04437.1 helicase associated domain-containing protein [Photobacterium damselae subsp. damselae]